MIWIVNLNSNCCRIFEYQKSPSKLSLVKEISHPELKMKTGDMFTSDRPGHYQTTNKARGTYSQPTDPKKVEIENFAREIARELNLARNNHQFDQIILISPAQMSGLLLQYADKHVKEMITHHIHKDLIQMTDTELLEFVQNHAKYPEH